MLRSLSGRLLLTLMSAQIGAIMLAMLAFPLLAPFETFNDIADTTFRGHIVAVLLFGKGGSTSPVGQRFLPIVPGWFIGIVWLVFFLWIAIESSELRAAGGEAAQKAALHLRILLLSAAAYPFYTVGLRSAVMGLVGNVLTMGLAAAAFHQLRHIRLSGRLLPAAVIGWLIFASFLIFDENRWFW